MKSCQRACGACLHQTPQASILSLHLISFSQTSLLLLPRAHAQLERHSKPSSLHWGSPHRGLGSSETPVHAKPPGAPCECRPLGESSSRGDRLCLPLVALGVAARLVAKRSPKGKLWARQCWVDAHLGGRVCLASLSKGPAVSEVTSESRQEQDVWQAGHPSSC